MSFANSRIAAVTAFLMLASTGAVAQAAPGETRQTAAPQSQAQNQAADERKICVQEKLTGSRVSIRTCRTAKEWIRTEGAVPTN